MDFIAHALWMYIIFYNKPYLLLAIFFGIFPDLVTFTMNFFNTLATRKYRRFNFKDPETILPHLPKYIFMLYKITHSLVIFLIAFAVVNLVTRQTPFYMLAWLLHIVIDIPTHTKKFFPVHFLYPISNYAVDGFAWANKKFLVMNYIFILIFLLLRILSII